jgi:hypothetical protein
MPCCTPASNRSTGMSAPIASASSSISISVSLQQPAVCRRRWGSSPRRLRYSSRSWHPVAHRVRKSGKSSACACRRAGRRNRHPCIVRCEPCTLGPATRNRESCPGGGGGSGGDLRRVSPARRAGEDAAAGGLVIHGEPCDRSACARVYPRCHPRYRPRGRSDSCGADDEVRRGAASARSPPWRDRLRNGVAVGTLAGGGSACARPAPARGRRIARADDV